MPRRIMDFGEPDRFAAGTVGEPGDRTFFLQAVQGPRISSVALEKTQVARLAERLMAVVDELERRGLAAVDFPAGSAEEDRPLDEPLREEFRVGILTISWDDDLDRLVVEARSQVAEPGVMGTADDDEIVADEHADDADDADEELEDIPDDAPIGPDILRVRLTATMAQQFARRAIRVVAAGRPPCPFCGQPLDRSGHLCPRRNGSGYVH